VRNLHGAPRLRPEPGGIAGAPAGMHGATPEDNREDLMRSFVYGVLMTCGLVAASACGGDPSGGDCPDGQSLCNGQCIDTTTDPLNCGGCEASCTLADPFCEASACVAECLPIHTECDGSCVDTETNNDHCGSCGNDCDLDESCQSGICVPGECRATTCGADCVDTMTDEDHCGGCDQPCGLGSDCEGGVCQPSLCDAPPVAPGGDTCPAACTGGCDGTTCLIDCVGDTRCEGDTIVCPANFACVVTCSGLDACDTGTLECNDLYPCTIQCDGVDACGDFQVECGDGACTMECGPDPQSCAGAQVHCGDGACTATCEAGVETPAVDCGGSCGCAECP
jgi:hypothetical protein